MDQNRLIELIAAEVLNVVRDEDIPHEKETEGVYRQFTADSYRRPLLLVCGNPLNVDGALDFFQRFKERHPSVRVVLSRGAQKVFATARRPFAGFALRDEDGDFDAQVETFDSLIIVNSTINMVSKLADLHADTTATILVFRFLSAGKPVTLMVDGLQHWYFSPAIRRKVQADVAHLVDYGVNVVQCCSEDGSEVAAVSTDRCAVTDPALCQACGLCTLRAPGRVLGIIEAGAARVSQAIGGRSGGGDIARLIDHTLLKPDTTDEEVRKLCDEARTHGFASVCVNPSKVRLASELLHGSSVMVCTVVGFPLGATTAATKAAETREAIANGAHEIDMVINVGALKAQDYRTVKEDIEAVVVAAAGTTTKVILETSLLTDEEKKQACRLAKEAGADFVKTSTGFGSGGATAHDIALMRGVVGPTMGVKASGGVRDLETARRMIQAGATRIGASASVAIVKGEKGTSSY